MGSQDVTCLVCDDEEDPPEIDFQERRCDFYDDVLERVVERWGSFFTKDPFQVTSLILFPFLFLPSLPSFARNVSHMFLMQRCHTDTN